VIDIVLYVGRLLLIALLYLFLFAVMKTGIGIVKGQRKKSGVWTIAVVKGPKELRGVKINVTGPVVIGRSPGADIVIPASYVSGRHARVYPLGKDLLVEDLGSTNKTRINGLVIDRPIAVRSGDVITVGDVDIGVSLT
jgi:hypothetical protein